MTVEIGAILGAVGVIVGIVVGITGQIRQRKKDNYEEGGSRGVMQADISYIKRRTDDTLLEVKETNKGLNAVCERVTRVEESAKQAHKRIDSIECDLRKD